MKFLKSRGGAALVTALVVLCCAVFGMGRSLNAVRDHVWNILIEGPNGDGHSVLQDMEVRRNTASNLYTVAARYLDESSEEMRYLKAVPSLSAAASRDVFGVDRAVTAATDAVFQELEHVGLSEKDAKYVSGFRAELDSRAGAIARDPYFDQAIRFNTETLAAFPASLARTLKMVEPLPVYQ